MEHRALLLVRHAAAFAATADWVAAGLVGDPADLSGALRRAAGALPSAALERDPARRRERVRGLLVRLSALLDAAHDLALLPPRRHADALGALRQLSRLLDGACSTDSSRFTRDQEIKRSDGSTESTKKNL